MAEYILTFYSNMFIQFGPSNSTQKKKKKMVEEVTSVLYVMQFGQQMAIFYKALLFQSKVEQMHNLTFHNVLKRLKKHSNKQTKNYF